MKKLKISRPITDLYDKPIVAFKKGSMGEVFWEYSTLKEFIDTEKRYRGIVAKGHYDSDADNLYSCVDRCLRIKGSSTTIFHLSCRVIIKPNKP